MTTQLYKVLINGHSCHGGSMAWSLPSGKPGEWHSIEGDLRPCNNALHFTDDPICWYKWGCEVYTAEADNPQHKADDPHVYYARRARLIAPHPHPQWWLDTVAFVNSLSTVRWLQQHEVPLPEWQLIPRRAGTMVNAARDAVRNAAWNAARAAVRDAARDAAWAAARDAAWDAAWDAARDAARNATWNAAWDATLYVLVKYICAGLPIDEKHILHAEARMEVWRRGWVLAYDVSGKLFVYDKR